MEDGVILICATRCKSVYLVEGVQLGIFFSMSILLYYFEGSLQSIMKVFFFP